MKTVYCIDNKLGGITSFNYNIIKQAPAGGQEQVVIHIDDDRSTYSKANLRFPAEQELYFRYSSADNLYATIRRLHHLLPTGEGALVLNDCLEMQMLDHYPVTYTTYQVVHDEYNFTLAQRYKHVVDVFIAHSKFFYEKLLSAFPERSANIFFLPHGVNIPPEINVLESVSKPLQLVFLGRMTTTKGIFDLPAIDVLLNKWNVPHEWTCIGNGPELKKLQELWQSPSKITYTSPDSNNAVMQLCASKDVFVLPTHFEGSPVSLLETMSVGLVPVITDLPGGIREIVSSDIGYRVALGDTETFAKAIRQLWEDPAQLASLRKACMKKIASSFDVAVTAGRYHELFSRYKSFYRKKKLTKAKIGSRLDQPWIPSLFTKAMRRF